MTVRHIEVIHRRNRIWCELIKRNRRVQCFELSGLPRSEDVIIPDGFIRLSDAVSRLAQCIWGGLRRPAPLRDIPPKLKRGVSVGFGPWTEEAGRRLRTAAAEGELTVYVFAGDSNPVAVPREVLSRMIPRRGGLPDRPIRHSLKIAGGDRRIFELLQAGVLLVRAEGFNKWYRSERAKGKWASQRSTKKAREGRPSKQTDKLRNAVITAIREEKISVALLRRRLVAMGVTDVPSADTLARLVDQLYRETGELEFRRTRHSREQV
jgi:hypothetical protein